MRFLLPSKVVGKGFTILEMIVVIAIIGILATTVLVAMSGSRSKGGDGAIKQNLVYARTQAAFYFNGSATSTESYVDVCNDKTNGIMRQVQEAKRAYGGTSKAVYTNTVPSTWNTEECHADATRFVAWVPLSDSASGAPTGWCIDSTNASRKVTAVLGVSAFVCPP